MAAAVGGVDFPVTVGEAAPLPPWGGPTGGDASGPVGLSRATVSGPLRRFLDPPSATGPVVVSAARELVVIDSNVSGLGELFERGRPRVGVDVIVLRDDRDGLSQISEALRGRTGLTALHLISHGADGVVSLGNGVIDARTLASRSSEIAGWSASLAEGADLLVYGCDVAAGPAGRGFLDGLAALTGADVTGNEGLTGSGALGGDWTFEYATGSTRGPARAGSACSRWS